MMAKKNMPEASYGILIRNQSASVIDELVEQVRMLGYGVIDSGYSALELKNISVAFNRTRADYIENNGEEKLRSVNEYHTIRAPLAHGDAAFLRLALNKNLLSIIKKLIMGKFILNQQNGVINPPKATYNQASWHRDIPYQHFVSSMPIAINALFCVDDFTLENGATFLLPASHKSEAFPSEGYVKSKAIQLEAKAGSFIILDCMVFHSGGFNSTDLERRAINHLYNIPYFKQQINIPKIMPDVVLSDEEKEILGFSFQEYNSVSEYLSR
jgi:ectoine hydroxylase-related dioxygenase (phytanoyl-CoA dioxygenase family)